MGILYYIYKRDFNKKYSIEVVFKSDGLLLVVVVRASR